MSTWLRDLKPGDEVGVHVLGGADKAGVVEAVTAMHVAIRVDGMTTQACRTRGKVLGTGRVLFQLTPEVRERMHAAAMRHWVKHDALGLLHRLTPQQIEVVRNLVTNYAGLHRDPN